MEITLTHRADALQAVDEAIQYKRLVKGVAEKHGMIACFMAKPFSDSAAPACTSTLSLNDAKGANLFASDDLSGNALLRNAIGGMAATINDSMAIFAPNANSYRRFRRKTYAPVHSLMVCSRIAMASSTSAFVTHSGGMKRTRAHAAGQQQQAVVEGAVTRRSHSSRARPCWPGLDQLHADHEPVAAHVADARIARPAARASAHEIARRPWPRSPCSSSLHEVERRDRRRAAERVAAEGVAVRAALPLLHDGCLGDHRADRQPGAQALGERHDVRAPRPSARRRTSCRCGRCPTAPRRRSAGCRARRRARAGRQEPVGGTR